MQHLTCCLSKTFPPFLGSLLCQMRKVKGQEKSPVHQSDSQSDWLVESSNNSTWECHLGLENNIGWWTNADGTCELLKVLHSQHQQAWQKAHPYRSDMSDFEVFQKSFFTVQVRDDMYNVRDYAMILVLYYLQTIHKRKYIHLYTYQCIQYICGDVYVCTVLCNNYIDIWLFTNNFPAAQEHLTRRRRRLERQLCEECHASDVPCKKLTRTWMVASNVSVFW